MNAKFIQFTALKAGSLSLLDLRYLVDKLGFLLGACFIFGQRIRVYWVLEYP